MLRQIYAGLWGRSPFLDMFPNTCIVFYRGTVLRALMLNWYAWFVLFSDYRQWSCGEKMLTFWLHHSVTQYHSIGQTRRKLLLCISFPHIFSSFARFLASTGCTNHAVSVRYFPPVPAVSKALRTTGRTSSVDHDSWRWPGVSCWVFILFYYFFFCSISSPLADHTNKTTLGSVSRSRTQEGAKICKYVLALMRDDYVQRRFESFINVSVWLAHIINEGRAPSCFIFIPIDHLKVCQIALCLYLK